jgi:hypothetical protein
VRAEPAECEDLELESDGLVGVGVDHQPQSLVLFPRLVRHRERVRVLLRVLVT